MPLACQRCGSDAPATKAHCTAMLHRPPPSPRILSHASCVATGVMVYRVLRACWALVRLDGGVPQLRCSYGAQMKIMPLGIGNYHDYHARHDAAHVLTAMHWRGILMIHLVM